MNHYFIFLKLLRDAHPWRTGAVLRMQSGGFLEQTIAGKGIGLHSISTVYRF